jgi:hypothetical protein
MSRAKPSAVPETPPPAAAADPAAGPWRVGECYIIRTVTYHLVGRLTWVGPVELVLEDAAWVADSGRWAEALRTGKLSEVEPFPAEVIVGRGSITDATAWPHPLPRDTK